MYRYITRVESIPDRTGVAAGLSVKPDTGKAFEAVDLSDCVVVVVAVVTDAVVVVVVVVVVVAFSGIGSNGAAKK